MDKENNHKLYYSISEVSEELKEDASAIRYWEEQFEISPTRKGVGKRKYSEVEYKKLKLIHHLLRTQGMTINGAKKKLKENPNEENNNYEIIKKLETIKHQLKEIKKEFQ